MGGRVGKSGHCHHLEFCWLLVVTLCDCVGRCCCFFRLFPGNAFEREKNRKGTHSFGVHLTEEDKIGMVYHICVNISFPSGLVNLDLFKLFP